MIGNFIGDFIKGKKYETYSKAIQKGILLHRAIDEYTDSHAIVSTSKDKLREKYRHYSGVIVDVLYDHFLAVNWERYSEHSLSKFTGRLYTEIDIRKNELPERFVHMFMYMKRDNWLLHYASIEGIDRALTGMSRRTKFDSKMDEAAEDIKIHYEAFESEFNKFMPDIIVFSREWIEKNALIE